MRSSVSSTTSARPVVGSGNAAVSGAGTEFFHRLQVEGGVANQEVIKMLRFTRPLFLIPGVIVLVSSLGACAKEDPAPEPSASDSTCVDSAAADGKPVAGTAVRDSLKGVTLTFAAYGGEFQDAQQKVFTDPFAACTGAKVLQDATDLTKLQAMQKAGDVKWDVVYAGGPPVASTCGEIGLDIDPSKVDLSQSLLDPISTCQANLDVEPNFIVYNTDTFKDEPPTTVEDFFDTEKYPGKRLIWGIPSYPDYGLWGQIAGMLGWSEDSGEPFPYDEVVARLDSIKSDLVYYQTGAEQVQKLEQGDVAFASVWAARAYVAAENGAPYERIDDSAFSIADVFVPVGTKNEDAAFALVNYMMGAEQQSALTEVSVYGPANKNAKPEIPDAMIPWVLTAEQVEAAMNVTTPYWMSQEMNDRQIADRQKFFIG
jgi:putative spermidine/putrescine transport system substrate-binding protein